MKSFSLTVTGQFSGLLDQVNGMLLIGDCGPSYADLRLYSDHGLQASGTMNSSGTLSPVRANSASGVTQIEADGNNGASSDLSVIARAGASGGFSKIDMHAEPTNTGCQYWGTYIPGS